MPCSSGHEGYLFTPDQLLEFLQLGPHSVQITRGFWPLLQQRHLGVVTTRTFKAEPDSPSQLRDHDYRPALQTFPPAQHFPHEGG